MSKANENIILASLILVIGVREREDERKENRYAALDDGFDGVSFLF